MAIKKKLRLIRLNKAKLKEFSKKYARTLSARPRTKGQMKAKAFVSGTAGAVVGAGVGAGIAGKGRRKRGATYGAIGGVSLGGLGAVGGGIIARKRKKKRKK